MMKHAAIGALLMLMMSAVHAQDTAKEPWEEAERRLAKSRKVDVLGANIFGDQVSNSNGALSFSVTDVSLPGNNSLPVALTRIFAVENHVAEIVTGRTGYMSDYMFADWDLDLPSISGVFAPDWQVVGTEPLKRCSSGTGAPLFSYNSIFVEATSYWSGNTLKLIDGGGELLKADAGAPAPAAGGPYVWVSPDLAYREKP